MRGDHPPALISVPTVRSSPRAASRRRRRAWRRRVYSMTRGR